MLLNQLIDHTLLRPDATDAQIRTLCREARRFAFYAVCVSSCHVETAAQALSGSPVRIACVAGFPLGAMSTAAKVYEATDACDHGADEIDMVLNIGKLKSGEDAFVREDIAAVVRAAADRGAIVKVILETCLLTEQEIIRACGLAQTAGAAFVKTSTGFAGGGATVPHVALLRAHIAPPMQVKAAGGIRDLETVCAMVHAGADRIGTSAGVALMEAWRAAGSPALPSGTVTNPNSSDRTLHSTD